MVCADEERILACGRKTQGTTRWPLSLWEAVAFYRLSMRDGGGLLQEFSLAPAAPETVRTRTGVGE